MSNLTNNKRNKRSQKFNGSYQALTKVNLVSQTDKFIFISQLQALKKTLKRKKNCRFKVNMQLKLIDCNMRKP